MKIFTLVNVRWVVGALGLMVTLAGCNWFASDSSAAIFRLDISDATAVSISSNNLSKTAGAVRAAGDTTDAPYEPVLVKFTHAGEVSKVAISNANHSYQFITPVEVRAVDDQWLAVLIYTHSAVIDEDSSPNLIVFVDTTSGEAFALQTDLIGEPSVHGYSVAVDGYLYMLLLGEEVTDPRGGVYRIRPDVTPTKERVSKAGHQIDASQGGDSVTFTLGDDGTLLYRHDQKYTAIHVPSGTAQDLGTDIRSFWRGLDGHVYYQEGSVSSGNRASWRASFSSTNVWAPEEFTALQQDFFLPALVINTAKSVLGVEPWRVTELYNTNNVDPLRRHELYNYDTNDNYFDSWIARPAFVAPVGANLVILDAGLRNGPAVLRLIEVNKPGTEEKDTIFAYRDLLSADLNPRIDIFTIAPWDDDHILVGGTLDSGVFVKATIRMSGDDLGAVRIVDEATGTAMRQLEHLRRGPARIAPY